MTVDLAETTIGQVVGDDSTHEPFDRDVLSQQRLDDFAEFSDGYFWEMDKDLRYSFLSRSFAHVTGIPRRLALSKTDAELGWCKKSENANAAFSTALGEQEAFQDVAFTFRHTNGQLSHLAVSAKALQDAAGRFSGFRGVARKQQLPAIENRSAFGTRAACQLAGRIANVGFWEWDEILDQCAFCSEELARIHGLDVQQFMKRVSTPDKNRIWLHPDDRQRYDAAVEDYMHHRQGYDIEYRLVLENGDTLQVLEVVVPIVDQNNRLIRSFGFVKDVSEQKSVAAELERARDELDARVKERTLELEGINEELSVSKSQLREATRIAKLGYFRWSAVDRRCIYRDEELSKILGADADDFLGDSTEEFFARVHADDLDRLKLVYRNSLNAADRLNVEYRIVRPNGDIRHVNECSRPILDERGIVIETIGTVQDITERKLISAQLAFVEERLSELGANAREVLYVLTADWREVIYVSKAFENVWGHSCKAAIANPRLWHEALHPDDRDTIYAEIGAKMSGEDPTPDFSDARVVGCDGEIHWLAARVYPIRDVNGTIVRFAGVAEDITERKLATDALHRAQKLEAVGQLTGGIAHDFNNLLAVILGNTELLLTQSAGEDAELLRDVLSAGRRGAELTKRLLAFSRLQPLQPKTTELNALLVETGELLRRTLGTTISVIIQPSASSINLYVDPGLFENALLNLALNSRDAMANGGRLDIQVHKKIDSKGCNVLIKVEDNGAGMSPDVLSHALEPYFTTKELGEGSGLGLSMVYGFLKQSDGDLRISSELGEGTTVTIKLPCECT